MEVVSRENAPHYRWGQNSDGWRLVDRGGLTVIQERMSPGSAEIPHYHRNARQFFFVLEGELTIERPGFSQRFGKFEGLEVLPGEPHHVRNCSESEAVFLVVSSPRTHGDRVEFALGLPTPVETVITYVEMHSPGDLRPKRVDDPRFSIRPVTTPQWKFNRFLYTFIGEGWNWTDKNVWSDDRWRAYAESPNLQTFVAYYDGSIAGYFELERQDGNEVEITYLGVARGFLGRGFGGALVTRAVEEAWKWNVSRVWLHTCTLDHSAALPNYLARGFMVYKTEMKCETLERS
jgi:mannose-6-phosphate isomerase-like protein (cupin superfamily)/GNAT superfamily N-acetyltransferase